jgi:hypothetical protein
MRRRIAIMAAAASVVALGTAPIGWADNSGPPKPARNQNNQTLVCHGYPGVTVDNRDGLHGTPDTNACAG